MAQQVLSEVALSVKNKQETVGHPLTIGIAAHNEAANIGHLLEVLRSEISKDDQIVVVASGCTDQTVNVVRLHASVDPRVRLIVELERKGKAKATNEILSLFDGDMLLLISGDVLPEKGSLEAMVDTMRGDPRIGVVSSRPVPINSQSGLLGYVVHLYWRLHHRTLAALDANGLNTHGGEAILVRKGVVSSLPGDCINDDAYVGVEAVKKGLRVKYCPEAVMRIKAPESIVEVILQRRRIVTGHLRVRKHTGRFPRVLTTMAFTNPSFVLRILVDELRDRPRALPKLLASFFLETVSAFVAMFDRLLGHEFSIWIPALSTKILSSDPGMKLDEKRAPLLLGET